MTTGNKRRISGAVAALLALALVSSCAVTGPVNIFSKPEKIPRLYAENYNIAGVEAPRSELNRQPWIVFADRDKDASYIEPGGKIKLKDVNFLDAFLIIGRKGNYVKLIKYDPSIVKNGRLTDRKKAEYYGWMDVSHLVLSNRGYTDVYSGLKIKYITAIIDTSHVMRSKAFFDKDSLKLFKDPQLTMPGGGSGLNDVVYVLKRTEDGKRALIAKAPVVKPDEAASQIMGWVDASLVHAVGQQLFADLKAFPEYAGYFSPSAPPQLRYSPAWNYIRTDSIEIFDSAIPFPVVDKSDNFVLNVAGTQVTYDRSKALERDLARINVVWLFEMGWQTIAQFPGLISAVQTSQMLFDDNGFTYNFGAVIAMQDDKGISYDISPLSADYSDVVDLLMKRSENMKNVKPIIPSQAYNGLNKALDMLGGVQDQTNIIIFVGETGNSSENAEAGLIKRLADRNCRLLGFQTYGGEDINYTNFVLQVAGMIEGYATIESMNKKNITFFTNQLRGENAFKELDKNSYTLDYPDRSMTQGAIVFPEKDQSLSLETMTATIGSFYVQVKADNTLLIESMYKAFGALGSQKDKFDPTLVARFGLDPAEKINRAFKETFIATAPVWYGAVDSVAVGMTDGYNGIYHLMLSAGELEALKRFIADISSQEVDYKANKGDGMTAGKSDAAKQQGIYPVNIYRQDKDNVATHSSTDTPDYASTGKIRRHFKKLLISEIRSGRVYKMKRGKIKKLTLAEAQLLITSAPSYDSVLITCRVRDLKRKKILTDYQLDRLIEYFKDKKAELDAEITDKNKFNSSGQDYIWIDSRALP